MVSSPKEGFQTCLTAASRQALETSQSDGHVCMFGHEACVLKASKTEGSGADVKFLDSLLFVCVLLRCSPEMSFQWAHCCL